MHASQTLSLLFMVGQPIDLREGEEGSRVTDGAECCLRTGSKVRDTLSTAAVRLLEESRECPAARNTYTFTMGTNGNQNESELGSMCRVCLHFLFSFPYIDSNHRYFEKKAIH